MKPNRVKKAVMIIKCISCGAMKKVHAGQIGRNDLPICDQCFCPMFATKARLRAGGAERQVVNEFDEGFLEWLCGCYRRTLDTMPPEQRAQIEAAFYAGAAFAGRVAEEHGHEVVISAIKTHLERTKCTALAAQGESRDENNVNMPFSGSMERKD